MRFCSRLSVSTRTTRAPAAPPPPPPPPRPDHRARSCQSLRDQRSAEQSRFTQLVLKVPSPLDAALDAAQELEATAIVNVLRRAGWSVTLASVGVADGAPVLCARGQRLLADSTIEEAKLVSFDVVAIPGGMPGAERLGEDASVIACLRKQREAGNWYGAICAAPAVALAPSGLLPPQATCHPAFESTLAEARTPPPLPRTPEARVQKALPSRRASLPPTCRCGWSSTTSGGGDVRPRLTRSGPSPNAVPTV